MWFRANKFRVAVSALGFLSVIFAPWWMPLICAIFLCVRYAAWEVLLIGLFADLLWLPQISFTTIPIATIAAGILVFGLAPLRKELLIHTS